MARGKPFFKGLIKKDVTLEVQSIVNDKRLDEEFASDFISDLIQEKHYFCSLHSLRPSKFRKKLRIGGSAKYNFEGFFSQKGWRGVSWRKCITPPNRKIWAAEALRLEIQPQMFVYKNQNPVCEKCGINDSTEVDHVSPEFEQILDKAFDLMSEADWETAFKEFDWWNDGKFRLPGHSPALISVLEAHKDAVLKAVCKSCHVSAARERRG